MWVVLETATDATGGAANFDSIDNIHDEENRSGDDKNKEKQRYNQDSGGFFVSPTTIGNFTLDSKETQTGTTGPVDKSSASGIGPNKETDITEDFKG